MHGYHIAGRRAFCASEILKSAKRAVQSGPKNQHWPSASRGGL
jgi:hypothetical protein